MKIYTIAFALIVAGISVSCGSEAQTQEKEQEQKQITKDISAQEFSGKMNSFDNVQLLDVRRPEEWATGIIPGAARVNWFDEDFMEQVRKFDKDIPLLIYCASGGRSGKAMEKMSAAGYSEIYNLEGGIGSWESEGLEISH